MNVNGVFRLCVIPFEVMAGAKDGGWDEMRTGGQARAKSWGAS